MSPFARASVLALTCILLSPLNAAAFERGEVDKFATLPAGFGNPEGIAADSHGNIYVTTFMPTGAPPGQLFVFSRNGHLLRQVAIAGSSNLLLGLDFHPHTGELLVIDFGNARVLKVNPFSGAANVFTAIDPPAGAGLNALTFDKQGNVYFSDSFRGIIWRTNPYGGDLLAWVDSPLLRTSGVPPFGANGLAFNKDGSALFVANTGDDRIIEIPVTGGAAGAPKVFVNSINGADGLIIDRDDNVWVAANQANEILVVDKTGRVIAKLGDFDGLDRRSAPKGFLFPASLVRHDGWIYVTNLALDLRLFGHPTVDSQWADEVKSHTISRIRARIPRISGLCKGHGHGADCD
jgi:DNA-binding beta-propeller fold protein YncE